MHNLIYIKETSDISKIDVLMSWNWKC